MFVFADVPQSMGRVLDDGIALYRAAFLKVLPLSLIASVMMIVPNVVVQHLNNGSLYTSGMTALTSVFMLVWIAMMLCYFWLTAAIMLRMTDVASNHTYGQSRSRKKTIFGIGSVLLLCTLIYFAAVFLGLMLLIPGIIVSVSFALYAPIAVLGDEHPLRSLGTSHTLVWGNWWRTMVILTMAYIFYMLFSLIPYGVWGAILGAESLGMMENPTIGLQVVASIFAGFVIPLILSIVITTMHDLRMRRLGVDLALRMAD